MARSDFDSRFPPRASQAVKTLARNIRRLRKARGWTQDELAQRAKIEQAAISVIENGRANPTIGTVETIASCLGVTFIDLFESKVPKS